MTLVNQLRRIAIEKELLISQYHTLMDGWVSGVEKQLMKAIESIISNLDTVNGVIQNTQHNLTQLARLEADLRKVNNEAFPQLLAILDDGMHGLNKHNDLYFASVFKGVKTKLAVVAGRAERLMMLKLGITKSGELIQNGWMTSVVNDTTILRGIKDILIKGVIGRGSMKLVREALTDYVLGNEERVGRFASYIKQTVYDVFQQHDAAYSANIAEELGFNHFVYTGGLIETSRDFCREHDGRVYHKDETKEWPSWTPAKAIHITEFKQKDLYAIPSYINYTGYNPIIDRGGYNCRHFLTWVADDTAEEMRKQQNVMDDNQ